MQLEDFLSSDAYTPVNKALAKKLGFVCAGFLGELIRQRKRFGGGEFYFSQENMEKEIGISAKVQRSCIGILVEKGYLSVDKHGAPCRNWYIINDCAILNCYAFDESGGQTRCAQREQLDVPKGNNWMCPNGTTYNNKETNKENKNKYMSTANEETTNISKEEKEKGCGKEKKKKRKIEYPQEFEGLWRAYPQNGGKKEDMYKAWIEYSEEEHESFLFGAKLLYLYREYIRYGEVRMSQRIDRRMEGYIKPEDRKSDFIKAIGQLNGIQNEEIKQKGLNKARELFGEDYVRGALIKASGKISLDLH